MANPLTSIDGDVHWNGAQVAHARGWTINPTNELQEFVTNLTKGKKNRRPGNMDVSGTFTIYTTDGNTPAWPGQIAELKLYVTSSTFWKLTNAIIESIDPEVSIEDNSLQGVTVNWSFAGADDGNGGSITTPDGTSLDKDIVGNVSES